MKSAGSPPIVGFIGFSGSGKTTLLKKLIALLSHQQLSIGLIKTTHHDFEIDIPGKDSYDLRKAGATQVLLASPKRTALISEYRDNSSEPELPILLSKLDTTTLDLVLIEGMKHAAIPKMEIHRTEHSKSWLFPELANVIAIASDAIPPTPHPRLLPLNDIDAIANFVIEQFIRT